MMLSFSTTVLKCLLVFVVSVGINGQEVEPYAIGFNHANTSLPSSTCMIEFDQVRSYVYPTYFVEVVTDSYITTAIVETISDMDNNDRRERELQNWCYGLCHEAPRSWLILNGCSQECGLRRRLDGSTIPSNDVSSGLRGSTISSNKVKERDLQTSLSTGNSTNILSGPGDSTVSQFFATVRVVIPSTNPCRQVLLDMTYSIIPLVIHV